MSEAMSVIPSNKTDTRLPLSPNHLVSRLLVLISTSLAIGKTELSRIAAFCANALLVGVSEVLVFADTCFHTPQSRLPRTRGTMEENSA